MIRLGLEINMMFLLSIILVILTLVVYELYKDLSKRINIIEEVASEHKEQALQLYEQYLRVEEMLRGLEGSVAELDAHVENFKEHALRRDNSIPVKVVCLDKSGEAPIHTIGNSGVDLRSSETITIAPGETRIIPTGLAFELPPFTEIQIRPRSGISAKTKLRVILGTVDASYRGPVGIIAENIGTEDYLITKGDRIAQAVFMHVYAPKIIEVAELSHSERSDKGFGSSGIK